MYGYMKKKNVDEGYTVIRIGGETLEELVEKRAQYIEQGWEESTVSEWIEDGGTPDEVTISVSEPEPTDEDSSEVVAKDIYAC